jgi:hypothetical protein
MINGINYPAAPDNPGWVLGWGVFKMSPWHFVGLMPTRSDAITCAQGLGDTYQAAFGSHQVGTDNFVVEGVIPADSDADAKQP